ncbi:cytochrome P450 [Panaeolus papilionaceus]|nr:cytochrome P450 [Panaeolus papilionaceus]
MTLLKLSLDTFNWQEVSWTNVLGLGISVGFLLYYKSESRKLSHIPSMGSTVPILSFMSAFKVLFWSKSVIMNGVKRYPGIFKIPEFDSWLVVAADKESMEDIRKAREHVLSASAHLNELLQGPYTFGAETVHTSYHLPLIHGVYTKSIPLFFPDVYSEICDSFPDVIPPSQEWTSFSIQSTMMHIFARAASITFVGKPLCQNKDYINNSVEFTQDALKVALTLRPLPSVLKPIVNYFISGISQRRRKIKEFLLPAINARRQALREGADSSEKPMDLLTWLVDTAKGKNATDDALVSMMLFTNFGAIHSPSMALTHAIFYLAANPKFVELLREEVSEVTSRCGWTKEAVDEMVVIDSFIRESQRLHAGGQIALTRQAVQDFTFSNGVTIPKGTTVSVTAISRHLDESIYPDPNTFDPLRFVKMASNPEFSKKADITAVGLDLNVFGYGRHACPGRFFAAVAMKLILAYMVTHYDLKFPKDGGRPSDLIVGINVLPNPFAKVLFRKRL